MIKKVIISGGGTGGHIYPAVAIAEELQRRNSEIEILFVGASDRMEMQKIPELGYAIKGLWISGFQRSLSFKNLLFPLKLMVSLIKAYFLVKKFRPDYVVGTGGYASGPTLYVANKLGIPTLIQEQNSFPGITNRLLGKTVNTVAVAYEDMGRFFPEEKIMLTGNPLRSNILSLQELSHEGESDSKLVLFVMGGSLGSKAINQLISDNLDWLLEQNIELIWQTGSLYFDKYRHLASKQVEVMDYIKDMPSYYKKAGFIISRAGASSVSELCLVGKPVLFIPSPNVAEDHQRKNAEAVVKKEAAEMLLESNFGDFRSVFKALIKDRDRLERMSHNIKDLAKPNAAVDIVNIMQAL